MDQTRYPQTDCYYQQKQATFEAAQPISTLNRVRLNDVILPLRFAGIKCLIESDRWI